MSERQRLLLNMFTSMRDSLGPSHWWPGETRFEKAVGAILTQNTNWKNVEKAIWNLKQQDLLNPAALHALTEDRLSELIRPAGYFRVKAGRLKNFLTFLREEGGLSMETLCAQDLAPLRIRLLTVKGIGPETADSILLYALDKPTFVVDAYTARILHRHGLAPETIGYEALRGFFMDDLPRELDLFNEYHALLVRVGKTWCRKKFPACTGCPLAEYLPRGHGTPD